MRSPTLFADVRRTWFLGSTSARSGLPTSQKSSVCGPDGSWGHHDAEDEDDKPTVFGGWFMASEWVTYGCEDGFLGWNEDADVMPTHWTPLPTPPAEGSGR
jgi:hypothetical protein